MGIRLFTQTVRVLDYVAHRSSWVEFGESKVLTKTVRFFDKDGHRSSQMWLGEISWSVAKKGYIFAGATTPVPKREFIMLFISRRMCRACMLWIL